MPAPETERSAPAATTSRQPRFGRRHVDISRRRSLGKRASSKKLSPDEVTVVDQPMLKRAIGAAALGNTMEWFDFGVYGYLAATLGKVFYPEASTTVQTLSTFATFAAAFLARPIGGVVFGLIGDRLGRQKVLSTTMIMMAVATFLAGCIPSYASIGIWAPILLLGARLMQGFSTGGEYAGATTFIAEYSPDRRRGFLGSWLDFGTFIGYALGSGLVTILNLTLGPEAMLDWGWRIPFFIAGPIGLIGLYLRVKLEDTPAFQQQMAAHDERTKAHNGPFTEIRTIVQSHWRQLLVCMGLVLLYNVTVYMVTAYFPTYLTVIVHRSQASSDLLILISMVVVFVTIVAVGRISDHVGRRIVLAGAAVAQIIVAVPLLMLMQLQSVIGPLIAVIIFGLLIALFAGPSAATLPALFPTNVRYGALSISFNLSVSLFCGTTPFIASALFNATHNAMMPAYMLIVSGIVGLIAVLCLRESAQQPLDGSPPQVDNEKEAHHVAATANSVAAQLKSETVNSPA